MWLYHAAMCVSSYTNEYPVAYLFEHKVVSVDPVMRKPTQEMANKRFPHFEVSTKPTAGYTKNLACNVNQIIVYLNKWLYHRISDRCAHLNTRLQELLNYFLSKRWLEGFYQLSMHGTHNQVWLCLFYPTQRRVVRADQTIHIYQSSSTIFHTGSTSMSRTNPALIISATCIQVKDQLLMSEYGISSFSLCRWVSVDLSAHTHTTAP